MKNISHEIRTPLSSIINYLESLKGKMNTENVN